MSADASLPSIFHEIREGAGFTIEEAALQMGISKACVYDLESYDDELDCYSLHDLQKFARVMGVPLFELFGLRPTESLIPISDLTHRITEHCHSSRMSLEQFEDVVGWSLAASMDPPEIFLKNLYVEELRDICHELRIEWQQVVAAL